MAKKKKQPLKIGGISLTDHEREVIAEGVNSEFFKVITKKIIPQREVQIALTLLHGGFDEKDLYFYKGMLHLVNWFPGFIQGEAEKVEEATSDDGDENDTAEDDHSI